MRVLVALLAGAFFALPAFADSEEAQAPSTSTQATTAAAPAPMPDEAMKQIMKAYESIRQHKLDEAKDVLCNVIRTWPNNMAARRYLSYVLLAQGQPQEALDQLRIVIASAPPGLAFDNCLAGAAFNMSADHEHALEAYQAALEIAPNNEFIRERAIEELSLLGEFDKGIDLCVAGLQSTADARVKDYYRKKYYEMAANRANIAARVEHAKQHANDPIYAPGAIEQP